MCANAKALQGYDILDGAPTRTYTQEHGLHRGRSGAVIFVAGARGHGKSTVIQACLRGRREPAEFADDTQGVVGGRNAYGVTIGFIEAAEPASLIAQALATSVAINYGLLVIAADEGITEETREHLRIFELLGAPGGVIVLTRVDSASPDEVARVMLAVREISEGTPFECAELFVVSSCTGEGVGALRRHLHKVAASLNLPRSRGNFRLAVQRVSSPAPGSVRVIGTALSGTVKVGDTLIASGSRAELVVREVRLHKPMGRSCAGAGMTLMLSGEPRGTLAAAPGGWLVAPSSHHLTSCIDARVNSVSGRVKPLEQGRTVHVCIGTCEVPGRVTLLESQPIEPRGAGLVRIELDFPVIAAHGDRIILTDPVAGRAIAGGPVLDPFGEGKENDLSRRALLQALELPTAPQILHAVLTLVAFAVDLTWIARALNLHDKEADGLWACVDFVRVKQAQAHFGVEHKRWHVLLAAVRRACSVLNERRSHRQDLSAKEISNALPSYVPRPVVHAALNALLLRKEVQEEGGRYRLPTHTPVLGAADVALWERIRQLLLADETCAPSASQIATTLGCSTRSVLALLEQVSALGLVHRIAAEKFILPEALTRLVRVAQKLCANHNGGSFGEDEYREHSGVSSSASAELLGFLDRSGALRRFKNGRRIVLPAAHVFV